jgi:hypothetical protein
MVRHHHAINRRFPELFHRRRGLANAMCILCTRATCTGKLCVEKLLHDKMCMSTTGVITATAADTTATAILLLLL